MGLSNEIKWFFQDLREICAEVLSGVKEIFLKHTEHQRKIVRNWMDQEVDHSICATKVAPSKGKGPNDSWLCPHGVKFLWQKSFGSNEYSWKPRGSGVDR